MSEWPSCHTLFEFLQGCALQKDFVGQNILYWSVSSESSACLPVCCLLEWLEVRVMYSILYAVVTHMTWWSQSAWSLAIDPWFRMICAGFMVLVGTLRFLAGARRRQNLYGILLPGANISRAFFRTGLVALWFALPFKPPISSPMPIRVWSDSTLCKLIFSISSGHFSNRISFMKLLTDGCARRGFLQQKLCNVPACQDVVWSNLQMAHWCSLSLKGNFLWLLPW